MEKKSLYGIQSEYQDLIYQIMEAEGEITPEQSLALVINKSELTKKSEGYIAVINKLKAEMNYIDAEVKRLGALKKARKNAETRLKDSIKDAMELYDIQEIKTELNKISFSKSTRLEISIDADKLPAKLQSISVTHIPKAEIKKMLDAGEKFKGIELVDYKNLQVK